jgi:hypothetical protein
VSLPILRLPSKLKDDSLFNTSDYQLRVDGYNIGRASNSKNQFFDVLKGISDILQIMEQRDRNAFEKARTIQEAFVQ